MELPDLTRIVETHVPLSDAALARDVLRSEVLPHIRELQAAGSLRWFSFLVHTMSHLTGHDPDDKNLIIHLFLERATGLDDQEFIGLLPHHFVEPQPIPASEMSGVNRSILRDHDWAYGWKLLGECSEWVLCLFECHKEGPPRQQIAQFLHYITNPLGLHFESLERF